MTTIESQTGNQEAIAGLAALVGDVGQDNARLPGQAASAFGALMGSLGQQATPVPQDAADDAQLPADDGAVLDEQAAAPQPQAPSPGDALMRAMWPVRQMAAPALTAPASSMGDAVPKPVSLSMGEPAVPAGETEAGTQAAPVLDGAQPSTTAAPSASAALPRPQQSVLQTAAPQTDGAQPAQATRLDVAPAPGLPRAAQPQSTEPSPGTAPADSAPRQTAADPDADSVMAWQRAAYAQTMAMPAPQPSTAAAAQAPSAAAAPQSTGAGDGVGDVIPTPWRASSAPNEAFQQVRAAPAGGEAAPAAPVATDAVAKTLAGPAATAAPARSIQAAPVTDGQTPQSDEASASAYAQAVPPAEARSSARRDDDGTREDSAEADEKAADSGVGAATAAASFFPASMMPAAVQAAPVPTQQPPAPERAPEAPRFDATTAFERSAQVRSLSRSNAAAEAKDSDAAESAESAEAASAGGKTTPFQHALQGSPAALVDGPDAQRGVQGPQELQASNAAAVPKEAVSHELSQAITQGANRVQMRIVPEGLGELDIKVQMTGQQVHLTIRGDAPELAQLLSHKVQELRADLQSQGLSLEAMDFGALASGSQGSSFAQEQRSGGGYAAPGDSDALGQGSLQRLAGSRSQAPAAAATRARGTGPSHRIIDVVL